MRDAAHIGAVVIGRNEGERLRRCLDALQRQLGAIVYVDSGSSDGSRDMARGLGVAVVELDMDQPFTAARARNAGTRALRAAHPETTFIQFIDGDCELQEGWIAVAHAFFEAHPDVAVVCGRRRERFPDASVYNLMIDREWDTPVGEALYCGGDALMRVAALEVVGGYNPNLIAGEEPELCVRLRQAGWKIWRLDAEMTWHDAALTQLDQWWKRTKRAGHAFAEGAYLHGAPPERHFVIPTCRALIWGLALPLAILVLAVFVSGWALAGLLLWPLQILRQRAKGQSWDDALFLTLGKFPEAQGAVEFYWRQLTGGRIALIEYK